MWGGGGQGTSHRACVCVCVCVWWVKLNVKWCIHIWVITLNDNVHCTLEKRNLILGRKLMYDDNQFFLSFHEKYKIYLDKDLINS